jgi:hypothetical protein
MASSTARFASASGYDRPLGRRNETKTNRPMPAARAAFTRFSCPAASTDSIESPACRERVEDAVEITASTPRHALLREPRSFRSPTHNSAPHDRRVSNFSLALVARTSARTLSPRLASYGHTSFPTRPVAPATRIIRPPEVRFYTLAVVGGRGRSRYSLTRATSVAVKSLPLNNKGSPDHCARAYDAQSPKLSPAA